MLIFLTFFCSLLFLFFGLLLLPLRHRQEAQERIETYLDGKVTLQTGKLKTETKNQSKASIQLVPFLKRQWSILIKLSKNKLPIRNVEKLELKLAQAGNPWKMSPVEFRLIQVSAVILITLLCVLLAFVLRLTEAKGFLLTGVGFIYALMMPTLLLQSRIKRRAKLALKELPDFVDLLTVSLEAGLGFDSALSKVIEKQKGVLSEEFHHCLDEIRLGKTRREGLQRIKNRLDVEELKTLISSVIRAERLGVGMVQVLRIQSIEVREKRKQRAEEQAMKAPIKMLFPLVIFIFPSLFVIILGPAVIQIIHTFKGM